MKRFAVVGLVAGVLAFSMIRCFAHCEIPCGIYDDPMRIKMIAEDILTIEKSMKAIKELKNSQDIDYNQLVRWINNKEHHANKIQEVVTQYFMTQRVKPADSKDKKDNKIYQKQLVILHKLLIYSMKCKQTTDLDNINKLRSLLKDFQKAYFGKVIVKEKEEHGHHH